MGAQLIDNRQKALIKRYQRMAGLCDHDYRDLLARTTGARSCTRIGQDQFDRAMAALESILWLRVDASLAPRPTLDIARWYWRQRCPADGMINSRLKWKLERWWGLLSDYLTEEERTPAYLAGIIHQASGVPMDIMLGGGRLLWERIPAEAARLTLEALKDRLRHVVTAA